MFILGQSRRFINNLVKGELKMKKLMLMMVLMSVVSLIAGCGGEAEKKKAGKKSAQNEHSSSDHIGGANPHKIELKDAPFNAMWEHAGDLVTITITDNEYKNETPIAAEVVTVTDAGKKNTFDLKPIKKDENGHASKFELESEKLEMTMDNKPTLSVKVGEKTHETVVLHIH